MYPKTLFFVLCCSFQLYSQKNSTQIAFIADAHFADVFPDLDQEEFKAILTKKKDTSILIRTMNAQVHSTRLFNENYFALKAALDDVVKRGIKLVAMPGDFSDDGQPIHIKGLHKILLAYQETHGLSFFMAPGNHDPTRPFGRASGKRDFLSSDGRIQPLMSQPGLYHSDSVIEHPTAILKGIKEGGYPTIMKQLSEFGFFPKKSYHFWSTPFSTYSYDTYSYDKARKASKLKERQYTSINEAPKTPDMSYLVEPVEGLWLLSLDANVYTYDKETSTFGGTGIGYNEVLKYKKHLIPWVSDIVKEANRLNKKLITFSHYPMVDFNDGASIEMQKVFGKQAFQAYRNPDREVGEVFANLGVKIHVGGHMHLNDTGIFRSSRGETLVNIQTPSLAAYPPAYKILTFTKKDVVAVETIMLGTVSNFDTFFSWYQKEHTFLEKADPNSLWNKTILSSTSYNEYTEHHLEELVNLRLLPNDFPEELVKILSVLNGLQLFDLSYLEKEHFRTLKKLVENDRDKSYLALPQWQKASEKALISLQRKGYTREDFKNWKGTDLVLDFYKLRNADQLALTTIPYQRIKQYQFWFTCMSAIKDKDLLLERLQNFLTILFMQRQGEPSINFDIDLNTGEVIEK